MLGLQAALCLVVMPCAAAPPEVEAAERLFDEARALMRADRYAEACPKLEQSQRLDPGLGTRLNLADCYEHTARRALAFREFSAVARAAEAAGEANRARVARERAEALEAHIARLVVAVKASKRATGLEIWRDSVPIPEELWGTTLAVDPGQVTIEARAPERAPWQIQLDIPAGSSMRVDVPELYQKSPQAGEVDSETASALPTWMRPAGMASAAVGAVGLGVGTVFGIRALVLYDHSQDQGCSEQNQCPPNALETRRRALRSGDAATGAFIVGGILFTVGATLYFVGPEHSDGTLAIRGTVGPGSVDASLEVAF